MSAEFKAKFDIGAKVLVDGEMQGMVIGVSFRDSGQPQYEVAWYNGDKLEEHWFHEWRLSERQK